MPRTRKHLLAKRRTQIPAHVSLPDETQIRKSLAHRNNYKKQFHRLERVIAIVIDDLGINQRRSLKAINLEGVYTLSFLTYGKNLRKLTGKAVKNGQEVFIHQGAAPLIFEVRIQDLMRSNWI